MNTPAPEFTLARTLDARPELVWRAWTEEDELAGWLPSTPRESISFDVREGGRYRYSMVDADSGEEFLTGGVFLEVAPFERLVFTWGDPGDPVDAAPVVTVSLVAEGDRTELTFHLRGIAGRPGDGFVYDGWFATLDDLVAHVTGQRPTPRKDSAS